MALADLAAQYGTRVVGLGVLSALAAAGVAFGYRVVASDRLDRRVGTLVGLAVAALYLNTRTALGAVVAGETAVLSGASVLYNSVALGVAAAATPLGTTVGDRVGTDLASVGGAREVEGEVGRLARSIGRVTAVAVPETVGDIEGYDPVAEGTKADLAETTLVFPGRLEVSALRERLATRLRDEYEVGYVDAEFDAAGDLTALSVGARHAGLGPTLSPGAAAVAVRADPAFAASAGDTVHVYRATGGGAHRVATAEVRATADDVVTLACDAEAARTLAGRSVRLVTLPAELRAERAFAAVLRAADETLGAVRIDAGADVVGTAVGDVAGTVVAVRSADGDVEAIPSRSRTLAAGETLYVVARRAEIRRLDDRAAGTP